MKKIILAFVVLVLFAFKTDETKFTGEFSSQEKQGILKIINSTAVLIAESDIPAKDRLPAIKQLGELHQFLAQRLDSVKREVKPVSAKRQ